MKGNYLLEIQQRHNVGHFPLKFAHDIDLHSLLNPLYVLGGGMLTTPSSPLVLETPKTVCYTNHDVFVIFVFCTPPPLSLVLHTTVGLE